MNWILHNCLYHFWVLRTSFLPKFWMTTSGNKKVQLCTPKAKVVYTGLYTYWNEFAEAWKQFVKVWQQPLFTSVRKKKFMAKSSNLLLGKKWRMKTNLNRGSPNNFIESALGKGGGRGRGQVMKITAKGHYKRRSEFVANP